MKYSLLVLLISLCSITFGQDCTITLDGSDFNVYGDEWPKGATVCINSNKRFVIHNASDVTITGSMNTDSESSPCLKFVNASNLVIDGLTTKGGNIGLQIEGIVNDLIIDGANVSGYGFAGIMVKDDKLGSDVTYNNITIRNSFIDGQSSTGEGLYIGNSFFANKDIHELHNVKIHDNIIKNTGAEGIQVGGCTKGAEIFNNELTRCGINPFNGLGEQSNTIQIGEGSGMLEPVKVYNNFIYDSSPQANAIIILGAAEVYNNRFRDTENIAFVDDRPNKYQTPNPNLQMYDNVFYNTSDKGITVYYSASEDYISDNIFIDIPEPIINDSKANIYQQDNSKFATLEEAGYTEELLPIDGTPPPDKPTEPEEPTFPELTLKTLLLLSTVLSIFANAIIIIIGVWIIRNKKNEEKK